MSSNSSLSGVQDSGRGRGGVLAAARGLSHLPHGLFEVPEIARRLCISTFFLGRVFFIRLLVGLKLKKGDFVSAPLYRSFPHSGGSAMTVFLSVEGSHSAGGRPYRSPPLSVSMRGSKVGSILTDWGGQTRESVFQTDNKIEQSPSQSCSPPTSVWVPHTSGPHLEDPEQSIQKLVFRVVGWLLGRGGGLMFWMLH